MLFNSRISSCPYVRRVLNPEKKSYYKRLKEIYYSYRINIIFFTFKRGVIGHTMGLSSSQPTHLCVVSRASFSAGRRQAYKQWFEFNPINQSYFDSIVTFHSTATHTIHITEKFFVILIFHMRNFLFNNKRNRNVLRCFLEY